MTTAQGPHGPAELARFRNNLKDEVDGAALYRLLAEATDEERLRRIYLRLAESEERHQAMWRRKLEEAGQAVPDYKPSARIRLIGWLARRFGVEAVAPLVANMEQGAFKMYDEQPDAVAAGLPAEERSHAIISREIARSGLQAGEIARVEGRHRAGGGNALRAAVLGAEDGLVSNFSLVMGVAGANPGSEIVLLAGLTGLLAGSLSMALGEWISVQSSREAFQRQVQIERDELRFVPEEEEVELALIYEAKGLKPDEARNMAKRIIADPEAALDTLTREELGMSEGEAGNPWVAAFSSFATFCVGAVFPIIPWLFFGGTLALVLSIILSGVGLFLTGAGTSLFSGRNMLFTGTRMLAFGLAAAAVAYGIGALVGVRIE